jgi:hypothetical protein
VKPQWHWEDRIKNIKTYLNKLNEIEEIDWA